MIIQCLLRSFGRIMGCLFGCFRIKDEARPPPRSHLVSAAVSSKNRPDSFVSRNRLASLLIAQDNGISPGKDTNDSSLGSTPSKSTDRELKDEAKFLKSCGTLLETPAEIRKASERVKDLLHDSGDGQNSKFRSWLPSASIKKLQWEEESSQVSISPIEQCEDLWEELPSSEHKPSRSLSSDQKLTAEKSSSYTVSSGADSSDTAETFPIRTVDSDLFLSVTSVPPSATTQCKNKSVRFEFESDTAVLPSNSQQSDSPGSHIGTKRSPYPTPLKLTDEMQTPGTVYPGNAENLPNGRNPQIRSQYVYHVLNPVQSLSQLMVRKEGDYCTYNEPDQLKESVEASEHDTPACKSVSYTRDLAMAGESTVGLKVNVDESLSRWLKPSSPLQEDKVKRVAFVSSGGSPSRTPDTERPILGTVATHWNDKDPARISPKWWDGNGIPNSTNKYKEDQKVSWHATPFEERLEKALSNETLVYQRRLSNGPVDFAQIEETDTAMSRLQSTNHAESVVSF